MEIYLVRHTETICGKGVCYGQSDVALAEPFESIFENIVSNYHQKLSYLLVHCNDV